MAPTQRTRIWLPDHLRAALDIPEGESGLSARLAAIVDRYQWLTADCPPMLLAEWMVLLDACNGWASWAEAGETLMVGLAHEVHDAIGLNGLGAKWGLTAEQGRQLVDRLRNLPPVDLLAVVERVERFWRRATWPTDAALMASGIHPVDAPELAYEPTADGVRRTAPPRFRAAMAATADGGAESGEVRWIDHPPADAAELARLMREAGEAWAATEAAKKNTEKSRPGA